MHNFTTPSCFYPDLIELLGETSRVIAPVRDADGAIRLREIFSHTEIVAGARAMIPLKKYLLPGGERIWFQSQDHACEQKPHDSLAIIGLPPCDIESVTLLDQVLGDDPGYRARRRNLTLVATPCTPDDDCRCQLETFPACDMFVDEKVVWTLSPRGKQLAQKLKCKPLAEKTPLPVASLPERAPLTANLAHRFTSCSEEPRWAEMASRCISCGACSAVCPTCFCYDLRDSCDLGGESYRERRWDNCLFSDFARVAGDHDFRSGTSNRLQFRMRHKLLGFGSQQGPSCLGCGRCRHYCPVDIGPEWLLDCMQAQANSP